MSKAVGIGRTSLYGSYRKRSSKDSQAILELTAAHTQHPLYGVRRLSLYLDWSINKTRRIRRLASVHVRQHKKYRHYKGRPEISAPGNHLHDYAVFKNNTRPQDGMIYTPMTQEANAWVQDFTYLRIRSGMYYLALVMDPSTREIVGWKLGTTHSSMLTHTALIQALRSNPKPSLLHSDRGSEYLSERHAVTCERLSIRLSASKPGSPWQNGYMERCVKSIKEELGTLHSYNDITELYIAVAHAIDYYNNERIHTALKMSPSNYARTLHRPRKIRELVFGKKGA